MVLLHRVWKKNPVSVDFLGIYIANDNQYSPLVHGLIGTTFFIWRNIFFVSAFSQSFCLKEMVAACFFIQKCFFLKRKKCFHDTLFLHRIFPVTFFKVIFTWKWCFSNVFSHDFSWKTYLFFKEKITFVWRENTQEHYFHWRKFSHDRCVLQEVFWNKKKSFMHNIFYFMRRKNRKIILFVREKTKQLRRSLFWCVKLTEKKRKKLFHRIFSLSIVELFFFPQQFFFHVWNSGNFSQGDSFF